jgi:hypothetical protein
VSVRAAAPAVVDAVPAMPEDFDLDDLGLLADRSKQR